MKLSKNFTLNELTKTSYNVDNTPNNTQINNLKELCNEVLQSIRDKFGSGILITSGFRSNELNKLIGGSTTSAHSYGFAADTKPVNADMRAYQKCVLEWAKTNKFDQIIIEYPTNYVASWIHIGIKNRKGQQRKQILYTKNGKNYYNITNKYYL